MIESTVSSSFDLEQKMNDSNRVKKLPLDICVSVCLSVMTSENNHLASQLASPTIRG